MKPTKADMKRYVIDCRAEESLKRTFSDTEQRFWDLAEAAPFEPTWIITTNEQKLADPYLMRVYLAPQREELEKFLRELGAPPWWSKLARHAPRPYLHYFFRGDDDRAYHNHPWKRSVSFILSGGYKEHIWDFKAQRVRTRDFLPGQVNYLRRGTFHKVELYPGQNCWTCFISSGRVEEPVGYDWDFFDPDTGIYTPQGEWTAKAHGKARSTPPPARPSADDRLAEDPHAGHGGYAWPGQR